jgi:hypothetical protein
MTGARVRVPHAATLAASFALVGLLAACGGGPGQSAELRSGGLSPSASAHDTGGPGPSSSAHDAGGLIIFDGDSLTEGYFLAPSQSYPSQAMRQLPKGLESANFGISGQTWQDLLRDVRQQVDPLFSPSRPLNLVVVWAGANDMAVGYSAQEIYENARHYCEARRRVGFTVVTATLYPLEPKDVDQNFEARRIRYNELLRRRRGAHRRPIRPGSPSVLHRRRASQRGRLRCDRRPHRTNAAPPRRARRAVGAAGSAPVSPPPAALRQQTQLGSPRRPAQPPAPRRQVRALRPAARRARCRGWSAGRSARRPAEAAR